MKLGNPVWGATLSQNGYDLSEEIGTYFSTGNRPNRNGWKLTGCVNELPTSAWKILVNTRGAVDINKYLVLPVYNTSIKKNCLVS